MGVVMIVKACRDDEYDDGFYLTGSDEEEEAREDIAAKGKKCKWLYSGIFLQAFALNFFAEWGDTNQITTILLAGELPHGVRWVITPLLTCSICGQLCRQLAVFLSGHSGWETDHGMLAIEHYRDTWRHRFHCICGPHLLLRGTKCVVGINTVHPVC